MRFEVAGQGISSPNVRNETNGKKKFLKPQKRPQKMPQKCWKNRQKIALSPGQILTPQIRLTFYLFISEGLK